jgi:hypothetical protein
VQVQLNAPAGRSTQAPLWWHGVTSQPFTSVSQLSPENPAPQVHLHPASVSSQWPELQGLESQLAFAVTATSQFAPVHASPQASVPMPSSPEVHTPSFWQKGSGKRTHCSATAQRSPFQLSVHPQVDWLFAVVHVASFRHGALLHGSTTD